MLKPTKCFVLIGHNGAHVLSRAAEMAFKRGHVIVAWSITMVAFWRRLPEPRKGIVKTVRVSLQNYHFLLDAHNLQHVGDIFKTVHSKDVIYITHDLIDVILYFIEGLHIHISTEYYLLIDSNLSLIYFIYLTVPTSGVNCSLCDFHDNTGYLQDKDDCSRYIECIKVSAVEQSECTEHVIILIYKQIDR